MVFLSPAKLLVVFVVVMIVVGPDRLPQVARQVGAALQSLRQLHTKVEGDLRESIPNLPSSRDIAHYARSPSALLNKLIEMPDADGGGLDGVAPVDRDALVPDPAVSAVIDTGPPMPEGDWPADHAAPASAPSPLSSPRVTVNGSATNGSSRPPAHTGDGTPFADPNMN